MADKDFLDYDLLIASGMSPPVANALLTMWERTGAARDVAQALDEIQAGVAQWGDIQGDIAAQTDLQAALAAIEPAEGDTFIDLGGQAGTRNLDYEEADVQALTVTGDLTLGVDNWPVPGELGELRVVLYDADQHTVSLPGTWADGAAPPFSSHDRIALYSEDGGNTVYKVRYFSLDTGRLHDNVAGEIAALTGKTTPVDADVAVIEDSAASNAKKKLSWANIKATLKTYFDTVYAAISHTHAASDVDSGTFADARIAESNVTQHQGALSIAESQISDLNHTVDAVSNVATSTILGRVTAGSGDSEELTATQVRTLINVEDGAAADQTDAEIRAAVEAATDSNVFTDADHSKLDGIEAGATAGDSDAIHDNVSGEIAAVTEKTAIVGADLLLIEDSEASNAKKRVQASNLPVAWANITGQEVDAAQDLVHHGKVFSGTETANLGNGLVHKINAAGDFTFALSGWPTAGKHETAEILAVGWGAFTVTLPDELDFGDAGAPTFSNAAIDRLLLSSDDNGALVMSRMDGQGFAEFVRLIAAGVIQSGSLTRNSTATYWDAASELQTAAVDTARVDHDPADGSLRGFLSEEERENIALQSEDMTNAEWSKLNLTVSAFNTTKFDDAFTLTLDAGTDIRNEVFQHMFTNDGVVRSGYRVALKAGTHDNARCTFRAAFGSNAGHINLITGEISGENAHSGVDDVDMFSEDIGDGWWLITITGVPKGTTSAQSRMSISVPESFEGAISWSPAGTETIHVAIPRGEEPVDKYVSSYTPTTTAAATREADNATDTITTWPVPVSYEIVATPSADQDGVLYQADDGSEDNRVRFERISGNLHVIVTNGGTEQANLDLGALTDFTEFTVRAAFADNDIAASLNSAAVVTDGSATIPTGLTTRRYGKDTAGEHWNAWIRDIDEHTQRLSNAELEA